jgi:broad specificity phosphatase PhoE
MKQNWPKQIWIVRHGESAGNVARDATDLAGHARISSVLLWRIQKVG